jgi:hypothetical protein
MEHTKPLPGYTVPRQGACCCPGLCFLRIVFLIVLSDRLLHSRRRGALCSCQGLFGVCRHHRSARIPHTGTVYWSLSQQLVFWVPWRGPRSHMKNTCTKIREAYNACGISVTRRACVPCPVSHTPSKIVTVTQGTCALGPVVCVASTVTGGYVEGPYTKTTGGNHACGHDGNTACTYTVARGAFLKYDRGCKVGDKCGGEYHAHDRLGSLSQKLVGATEGKRGRVW